MIIKYYLERKLKEKKWRNKNKHNFTRYKNIVYDNCVSIGNYTYGLIDVETSIDKYRLRIGNFCSIANGVKFILSSDHPTQYISTFPFHKLIVDGMPDAISKGNILVDDDVWIGYGATIMSGVHIGQGAIIAAEAVVTKDVPPYAIVGGVPAKVIKYRFSEEMISELMKVDYSKLTDDMVKEHIDDLYNELTDVKQLEWMPRK